MFTYRMNAELRSELHDGIEGEGWDEGRKTDLYRALADVADGEPIPYAANDEGQPDEDLAPVASLIEFFGILHLADEDPV